MEYAGSYALFNYRLEDPALGMEYSNLRLIRAFEHGLDPSSSEAGFVLVHVDMVNHSGRLVEGAVNALSACTNANRGSFNAGLDQVVQAMVDVNSVMDSMFALFLDPETSGAVEKGRSRLTNLTPDMWKKSRSNDYNNFRTFIFGITKQSMFPHGVVYEGVSEEPMSFRGESGANDSMVSSFNFF